MKNYKMHIQYDGSRYLGWQRLQNSDRTIQGKLESVISAMCLKDTQIIGSGRTDAGVHSLEQVANFKTDANLTETEMLEYINHYLPKDIVVTNLYQVHERFHSQYNAIRRDYIYFLYIGDFQSPFYRKHSWHIDTPLDMTSIDKAIDILQGTHDFLGFSSVKKPRKSTTRTLFSISYKTEGPLLSFSFSGDGFLHNMVRILMGSLIEVGQHKMTVDDIENVLQNKIRANAGITSPPHGLFLEKVHYDNNLQSC